MILKRLSKVFEFILEALYSVYQDEMESYGKASAGSSKRKPDPKAKVR